MNEICRLKAPSANGDNGCISLEAPNVRLQLINLGDIFWHSKGSRRPVAHVSLADSALDDTINVSLRNRSAAFLDFTSTFFMKSHINRLSFSSAIIAIANG
jgi:hypothetical protein